MTLLDYNPQSQVSIQEFSQRLKNKRRNTEKKKNTSAYIKLRYYKSQFGWFGFDVDVMAKELNNSKTDTWK